MDWNKFLNDLSQGRFINNMSDEKAICEVCGKEVDYTMTFSVGNETGIAICKKCFKIKTDKTIKQLREGQTMSRGLTAVKDIEKATEPENDLEYWQADAVKEIANKLIAENEVQFGHLLNFKIAYVFKDKMGSEVAGKAQVLSPLNRFLSGYDAAILISDEKFDGLKPIQQEALIAHELCHLMLDENENLSTEKHTVEEFAFVVGRWGKWDSRLVEFGNQLDLFERKGK